MILNLKETISQFINYPTLLEFNLYIQLKDSFMNIFRP